MVQDEAKLLHRAKEGDGQAFAGLVEPCLDQAYRLALRLAGDPGEAEDALQEALYKAWRALPRFRGDARFATWLYRIVYRVAVDRARKAKPLPVDDARLLDAAGSHDPAAAAWYDPESRWEGVEAQRELEAALQKLPPSYRAALTLYYVEGLTVRDIAGVLDVPVGTVKTHLHRARKALKRELGKERGGEGVWTR